MGGLGVLFSLKLVRSANFRPSCNTPGKMLAIGQTIGPSSLSSCHVVERKPNLIWRVRSDARFGSFIDANLPQLEADNQEVAAGGGEPQVVKSQVKMSKLREVKHTNSKLQDTHLVSNIVQPPHVLGLRPSAPLIHASLHIDLLPAAARCEPRHRGTPLRRAVAGCQRGPSGFAGCARSGGSAASAAV